MGQRGESQEKVSEAQGRLVPGVQCQTEAPPAFSRTLPIGGGGSAVVIASLIGMGHYQRNAAQLL